MLRLTPLERRQAYTYRDMIRRARRRGARERPKISSRPIRGRLIDRSHKAAIAQLFCVATYVRSGVELYGVHVAHLRFSNAAAGAANPGLQRKPDDRWTLPLSPNEHRRQHAMGEAAYWAELSIIPHQLATDLWAASPDLELMSEILRSHTQRLAEGGEPRPQAQL